MPHDKNGQLLRVGDRVKGTTYNPKLHGLEEGAVIEGTVAEITSTADQPCNCIVEFGDGERDYTATADLEKV